MKVKGLMKLLERLPENHEVIVNAKCTSLEVERIVGMAHTVIIVCENTPHEERQTNRRRTSDPIADADEIVSCETNIGPDADGMWRAINRMSDAPADNCFVAFTETQSHIPGSSLDDLINIDAGCGYLSWDSAGRWWSITECGEVIYASQVSALCPLPEPEVVVAGTGASDS